MLWARKMMQTNIGIGYRAMSTEYKLWRGIASGPFVIQIPTYWPDSRLLDLTEAIIALPFKLRKPLIGRYLFGYNTAQLARICRCSRRSIFNYINEAKDRLERGMS